MRSRPINPSQGVGRTATALQSTASLPAARSAFQRHVPFANAELSATITGAHTLPQCNAIDRANRLEHPAHADGLDPADEAFESFVPYPHSNHATPPPEPPVDSELPISSAETPNPTLLHPHDYDGIDLGTPLSTASRDVGIGHGVNSASALPPTLHHASDSLVCLDGVGRFSASSRFPVPPSHVELVSFRSSLPIIAAEEQCGLEHIQRVQQLGETFLPIADDNWEDPVTHEADNDAGAEESYNTTANPESDASDPFQYTPPPARPLWTPAEVHPNRAVSILYLLVLYLHTQFHLAFRACAAVLVVLAIAFRAAGSPIEPPMFTTLPPVIHHLGADVSMKICPVCPNCSKVFPSTIPPNSSCDRCAHPLFQTKVKPASKQQRTEPTQVPKPHLQFPSKSIEDYLTTMLAVPGMEDEMEAWRKKTRVQGTYTDIFDGEVCRTIKGVDGSPFFHPAAGVLEPNELRIGVSLGADW